MSVSYRTKIWDILFRASVVGLVLIAAIFARGPVLRNAYFPVVGEWILVLAHISKNYFRSDQEETTLGGILHNLRLQNVGTIVAISTAVSFVMYTFLAGGLHWYFYIQRRDKASEWKCQPEKFLTPENERHAIKMGTLNLLMASVISGFIACYIMNGGYTSLYYNISDRSLLHFIVSMPLVFLFNECAGYYSHRMFHIPVLYKTIHKWHHRYHQPTPLAATAMHPLEFLTYQAYYAAPAFIFPVHVGVYITVLLYNYYYGIIDHSGINMDALWPWQPSSIYHDNHHKYFHCNFGINTCLFDWVHDTIRREDRVYAEDVFGGHGKPKGKSH